ncbi:MAG: acyl CoA:acetate/3-ketoacid CoA transferase [Rhodoplanes sp.]|uniref:acyl CoA:acetate/3-ketoacid CoA transferase n=1 Tax=Rhodoplanes sp. TaxID=1968906 RepID=UPI00179B5970|nr:CoA-transferase [Rhodoplanes sp.]NVO14804.1 acyl CoA:acetate/3-ketoacid CoA transferase [Rhodoplanes sp.]
MTAKFVTAAEAADLVRDGATICSVGMTLVGAAESVLKALETRFLTAGTPRDLTLVHAAGQCDRERGIQHFAHDGMLKRIIGGHWGLAPRIMEMIGTDRVEAYNLPQGQLAQLYRSMACGLPGKMSKVGLGTYIDPRIEGGKMNARTRPLPDLVDVITYGGEEYLFYKAIPIDVTLVRGTTADEMGNISFEEEAMKLEVISGVLAAKRFGGKVIVQVKRVARTGTIHPKQVLVPGFFVDAIVVCDEPELDHRQSSSFFFDPSLSGDLVLPQTAIDPLPLSLRKVIGRRAMLELSPETAINLGTGIPNDVIGSIAAEEGLSDILVTVESGVYGGVPEGGIDFGVSHSPFALLEHSVQMDFYNGMGVPFTFMGAGELDSVGNVNATKFGDRCTGCGGFIDITQNAGHVVFCSTFTARGLDVSFADGKVTIVREGTQKKLVDRVTQVSFNGSLAARNGQKVIFVTERAVLELRPDGPVLVEIAPGLDLRRDVLDQMEFVPTIADDLKITDASVYSPGAFGLKSKLGAKAQP